MTILGIPIGEVGALLGITVTLSGAVMFLFKSIVISPLSSEIKGLNATINGLSRQLKDLEDNDKVMQNQIDELKLEVSTKSSAFEERFKSIYKSLDKLQ